MVIECQAQKGQHTWFVPSLAVEAEDQQSRGLAPGHSSRRQHRWAWNPGLTPTLCSFSVSRPHDTLFTKPVLSHSKQPTLCPIDLVPLPCSYYPSGWHLRFVYRAEPFLSLTVWWERAPCCSLNSGCFRAWSQAAHLMCIDTWE